MVIFRRMPPTAILAWCVLSAATAVGQTSIALRPFAALPESGPARLGDVADIKGPQAAELAAVILPTSANPRAVTIDLSAVRSAIDARGQFNWGQLTLSGGVCKLDRAVAEPETPQPSKPSKQSKPPQQPAAVDQAAAPDALPPEAPADESTAPSSDASQNAPVRAPSAARTEARAGAPATALPVRTVIARRLAALNGVNFDDVRLTFDPGASSPLLDSVLDPGVRMEVQPGASTASTRVPLRIDLYRPGRPLETRTFACELQIRREVLVAAGSIERDQAITESMLALDNRWMPAGADLGAMPEEVVGTVARRRIEAGRIVLRSDVQSPVIVQRGDIVWVHCFSGSVLIKAKTRALTSARDGETVTLQIDGAKKTFNARMSGRGTAVMELASEADAPRAPAMAGPTEKQVFAVPPRLTTPEGSVLQAPPEPTQPTTVRERLRQPRRSVLAGNNQ